MLKIISMPLYIQYGLDQDPIEGNSDHSYVYPQDFSDSTVREQVLNHFNNDGKSLLKEIDAEPNPKEKLDKMLSIVSEIQDLSPEELHSEAHSIATILHGDPLYMTDRRLIAFSQGLLLESRLLNIEFTPIPFDRTELNHLGALLLNPIKMETTSPHRVSCMANQFLSQAEKQEPPLSDLVTKVQEFYFNYLTSKTAGTHEISGYLETFCDLLGCDNNVDILNEYRFFISDNSTTVLFLKKDHYENDLTEGYSSLLTFEKDGDDWNNHAINDYDKTFSTFTLFQSAFRAAQSTQQLPLFFKVLSISDELKNVLSSTTAQKSIAYQQYCEEISNAIFPLLDLAKAILTDNLKTTVLKLYADLQEQDPLKQGFVLLSLAAALVKLSSADFFGSVYEGEPALRIFSRHFLNSAKLLFGTDQNTELEEFGKRMDGIGSGNPCGISSSEDICNYLQNNSNKEAKEIYQKIVPLPWQPT